MNTKIFLAFVFLVLKTVQSLSILSKQANDKENQQAVKKQENNQKVQRRILDILANAQSFLMNADRRSVITKAKNAKTLFDLLPSQNQPSILRDKNVNINQFNPENNVEHQMLVENELEDSLRHPKSVLLHNARVQQRGRNDFLVLEDANADPFVTVIPNNIYYNIEKKCVNWLDDCSLQGIRARLLEKVRGPYK